MEPLNLPESRVPRIVIVGGGFGGIALGRALKRVEAQVVLIDRNNYHIFQPLLYQVATAGLEPDSIAFPLRKIFQGQSNLLFRMAEARKILPETNTLETDLGPLHYDHLVLATGSATNFFGNAAFENYGMGLKSATDALDLRSLLLQNFERALLTTDLEGRDALMSVAIAGGGPTGVEIAGALAELRSHVLPVDYAELDFRRMRIHLIEAGARCLPALSERSSKEALDVLRKRNVEVWLGTRVTGYDGFHVETDSCKRLPCRSFVWTAGVQGAPVPGLGHAALARQGRLEIDEFLRVKGHANVYAIGDVASGLPMLAPVAISQGELLARNFALALRDPKAALQAYRYKDPGTMATIGRAHAVAELHGIRFRGFTAWAIWLFVHLISLMGFRNRAVVFVNWLWNYLSYDRGARLIIRRFQPRSPK